MQLWLSFNESEGATSEPNVGQSSLRNDEGASVIISSLSCRKQKQAQLSLHTGRTSNENSDVQFVAAALKVCN